MIEGKLTLVLPAHNEAGNIEDVVRKSSATLPRFSEDHEIIVVDDGSIDGTGEIAERLSKDIANVRTVHHDVNRGYGAALRTGFAASTGDWVMVMDSDQQFDIGDLVYLTPFVGPYDLVAGYRMHRNDPPHRILFGKSFRLAMRVLFGIQLYDIDCAFKIIRGAMLRQLNLESDGAMISTELMARWARLGATWTQVGVHHYPRTAGQQSGGSLRVILKAMRDVPLLWYRLNRDTERQEQHGAGVQPAGLSFSGAALIGLVVGTLFLGVLARLLKHKS